MLRSAIQNNKMLQLPQFYRQCYLDYKQSGVEEFFLEIDQKRKALSKKHLAFYVDDKIWTNKKEFIDDPEFNMITKKEIIKGLHLKNKVFNTYGKSIEILRPLVQAINKEEGRPARILELGSGTGKLTMALYEEFKRSSLQVDLTGSDIVAEFVSSAEAEALEKNYAIKFLTLDAFKLNELLPGSFDIVFTLHSMHHFTPGELSKIFKGAKKIATKAFIGIDGHRGIGNLFFMMLSGAAKSLLSFNSAFFHDSLISGRKMYSAAQLEILGKISCSHSQVLAFNLKPGLTVIKIY